MTLADLFTLTSLTDAINKLPRAPSVLGDSGLFVEKPVSTTSVVVDSKDGRLSLVPAVGRDDDPTPVKDPKRTRRPFEIPHLPTSGQLLPSELKVAGMGEEDALPAQAAVINDKLQDMRNRLEATREWQRVGAITGKILDADGRVIYNLYDEFGVTAKNVSTALGSDATDVRGKLMEAKRYAEKKLSGFVITGWRAYCDEDYFDALVRHPSVVKAYANHQEAVDRLGGDVRRGFTFGGIEHIEYNAVIGNQKFIASGTARLVPVVRELFRLYNAPANYNETVGTRGVPIYAKAEPRKMGKGWDLEAQANPLAMCLVPEGLVGLTA
ncbi:major capsid protein [Acidovorax sp. GBBC 3332]|nr:MULTISPECIES: major capsid protein [unclassified Acidovorax]MDA8449833.1 major capsid protein [Acidovorax sp. GBBC 3297]MDA8459278.1 major capsid protein [Acidovorax sp. GBBC 3333]MDA8464315.1 major capsid protein [Acidovorax sp. GBBC 3332]MDA8469475.1 major capsid protein [Acidovorax sp. GBBC 3299]